VPCLKWERRAIRGSGYRSKFESRNGSAPCARRVKSSIPRNSNQNSYGGKRENKSVNKVLGDIPRAQIETESKKRQSPCQRGEGNKKKQNMDYSNRLLNRAKQYGEKGGEGTKLQDSCRKHSHLLKQSKSKGRSLNLKRPHKKHLRVMTSVSSILWGGNERTPRRDREKTMHDGEKTVMGRRKVLTARIKGSIGAKYCVRGGEKGTCRIDQT